MTPGRTDASLSGRRLALALASIAVLAFALPPVLARQLHTRRVERASSQVQAVARALAQSGIERLVSSPELSDIGILTGPGDPPTGANDHAWVAARSAALQSYLPLPPATLTPDPWLRAVQVNIGAARMGGRATVLSAGPNGIIETPFTSMANVQAGGDDIAAPVP